MTAASKVSTYNAFFSLAPSGITVHSASTFTQKNRRVTPSKSGAPAPSSPASHHSYHTFVHGAGGDVTVVPRGTGRPPSLLAASKDFNVYIDAQGESQFLLVYSNAPVGAGALLRSIKVDTELIGKVSMDFSRFGGSYLDGEGVLYLTCSRKVKEACFFTKRAEDGREGDGEGGSLWTMGKGLHDPLGEQLSAFDSRLIIAKVDVKEDDPSFSVASDKLDGFGCASQPSVIGGRLTFTSYFAEPRKLGGVYCFQRPCKTVYADDMSSVEVGYDYVRHSVEVANRRVSFARVNNFLTHVGRVDVLIDGDKLDVPFDLYPLNDSVQSVKECSDSDGFYISVHKACKIVVLYVDVKSLTATVLNELTSGSDGFPCNVALRMVGPDKLAVKSSSPVNVSVYI